MRKGYSLVFFLFLLMGESMAQSGEEWDLVLSVQSTDTSVYRDLYNKAGVKPEYCSFQCDMWDVVELIPPTSEYLILYFPHNDITDPEHYWSPPCTGIYTYDRRPPTFTSSVWRFKIQSTYYRNLEVKLSWQGLETTTIPPYHSFWMHNLQNDSVWNLRSIRDAQYIFTLSRASFAKFDLEVRRNVIYRFTISPSEVFLRIGELVNFSTYLHETTGDSFPVPVSYTLHGDNGAIFPDGTFISSAAGNAYLIATYQIWSDTARIYVSDTPITRTVTFEPGWNMLSLPLNATDRRLSVIFPGLVYAFAWDPASIRYNSIGLLDTLNLGNGYFVLALNDTAYNISGFPISMIERTLLPGWNMLGSLVDTIPADSVKFTPRDNFVPPFYIYNPSLKRYEASSIFVPGKSYWGLVIDTTQVMYRKTRR